MNERTIIRMFPNASRSLLEANGCLPYTEPQQDPAPALERPAAREETSVGRVTVRVVSYRCRPTDADNLAGGCKGLIDGLRAAHLVRNDDPASIRLIVEQEKVSSRAEQRTEIELIYP